MRNGTQEELDAARDNARKLPFDAVFIFRTGGDWDSETAKGFGFSDGDIVFRVEESMCDEDSVAFNKEGNEHIFYLGINDLEVVK